MVRKIFFASNSALFQKSGREKEKKKGNYEAFCFSSKRKNWNEENCQCRLCETYLIELSNICFPRSLSIAVTFFCVLLVNKSFTKINK